MYDENSYQLALKRLSIIVPKISEYDTQNIINSKSLVINKYQPIFSSPNIDNITKEEFASFLLFKNNHHWDGIHRSNNKLVSDLPILKRTLKYLLDESKPIDERINHVMVVEHIDGFGKAIFSAILQVAYPDKYGVWNKTAEKGLMDVGLWPRFDRGLSIGKKYVIINEILKRLSTDLKIDLWTLDALWWMKDTYSIEGESNSNNIVIKTDTLENVDTIDDRKVWWVFQGKTIEKEKEGYLWAPIDEEEGTIFHHEMLSELKRDDIVINYSDGYIRYVSKVIELPVIAKAPDSSYGKHWNEDGRLVKLRYFKLDPQIPWNKFNEAIGKLRIYKGPINVKNKPNVGYLFRFSWEGLKIIQNCQPETVWPEFSIEHDSDDERVTNEFDEYYVINREIVDLYHYVRRPKGTDYWAYYSKNKLNSYISKYGDDFCIILSGKDNYYIIPFGIIKELFTNEHLTESNGIYISRWMVHIKNDEFYIRTTNRINVAKYRNNLSIILRSGKIPKWSDIKNQFIINFDAPLEIDSLYYNDDEKKILVEQIVTALKNNKNIILIGPPGTGKSKLAKIICQRYCSNRYISCTASSDWSAFETIGGYRLNKDHSLSFAEGLFLKCFRENEAHASKWMLIDEINRADIDKAFGALFSALTGDDTTLPYELGYKGEQVKIIGKPSDDMELKNNCYFIPPDWRIIATMNTFDKSSLYEMSYAFMRRFAIIPVDVPQKIDEKIVKQFINLWDQSNKINNDISKNLSELWFTINEGRKIGPAIIEDIYKFVKETGNYTSAVILYVIPQLEGLHEQDQRKLIEKISSLSYIKNDSIRLKNFASEYLGLELDEK